MHLALIALLAGASTTPSLPATVDAHAMDPVVADVIEHARTRALNAPAVDWPATQAEAARRFAVSRDEAARTDAIRYVLAQLADGHSFYLPPRREATAPRKHVPEPGVAPWRGEPQPIASASATRAGFGRLVVRSWTGDGPATADAARLVRTELNAALAHDACGVVVDVAGNSGGNMWPMMGGIAPLYDDGPLLTFAARTKPPQLVNVHDGALRLGDNVYPHVDALPALAVQPRFVAVIVGRLTASSGEILALGFRHQSNVRTFGAATAGATTSNSTIALRNGGKLALTTAKLLDRKGNVQSGPLLPDEPSGEAVQAAEAWLARQCR